VETIELSLKSCSAGPELHPSFDASSPVGRCPQSHELLLNKGMKYWDSGLNAQGLRTFIHITAMIGRRRSRKKGQGKLSIAPNLLLNWVSYPVEVQCTFSSCFLKSLCDQTGFPVASFPDFTDNFIECENRFLTKTWQFCGCGYEWHINGQTSWSFHRKWVVI
jgi:hypothetical protein